MEGGSGFGGRGLPVILYMFGRLAVICVRSEAGADSSFSFGWCLQDPDESGTRKGSRARSNARQASREVCCIDL